MTNKVQKIQGFCFSKRSYGVAASPSFEVCWSYQISKMAHISTGTRRTWLQSLPKAELLQKPSLFTGWAWSL